MDLPKSFLGRDGNCTIEGSKNLQDKEIAGDLIINGGGHVELKDVKVAGKIIVNDVSNNSLCLENVQARKIEINDANGARIKATGNGEHIESVEINCKNEQPLNLEGDFGDAKFVVNNASNIHIDENTSIASVEVAEGSSGLNITSNAQLSDVVGDLKGELTGDLKSIKNKIDENKVKIDSLVEALNAVPAEGQEDMPVYIERGKAVQSIIESMFADSLGEDYKKYDDYTKLRTANTIRTYMQKDTFTTISQVKMAFDDAKKFNRVFGEGMKYKAYHSHKTVDKDYKYPEISKDIKVGDDITGIVMSICDGAQLNDEITVTFDDEEINSEYFLIEDNAVKLKKLNDTGRDIVGEVFVVIRDTKLGNSSVTNFFVTIKSQDADTNKNANELIDDNFGQDITQGAKTI